jgi:GMP synthase (glutamine-hydrolysing)
VPIFGICYGAQLVAQQLGGEVQRTGGGEYGRTAMTRDAARSSVLLTDFAPEQTVWMSHGDAISTVPDGFVVTASTPGAPVAALESAERSVYGVQFHPEVVHTEHGQDVLERFLFDVCDCRPTWTNVSIIEHAIDEIRAQVGGERVICGLSAGSTPRSRLRWCTRPWATSSPACSSTTA